jgi:hypothetical protein
MHCFRVLTSALALAGSAWHTAHAQAADDCGPPLLPQLCVDFDAHRSVDAAAGDLIYRWRMGDSTTLTGLTISHCYKRRARYQVVLDVLVPATGEVRQAEKTFACRPSYRIRRPRLGPTHVPKYCLHLGLS